MPVTHCGTDRFDLLKNHLGAFLSVQQHLPILQRKLVQHAHDWDGGSTTFHLPVMFDRFPHRRRSEYVSRELILVQTPILSLQGIITAPITTGTT